jgi:hypothetical protein
MRDLVLITATSWTLLQLKCVVVLHKVVVYAQSFGRTMKQVRIQQWQKMLNDRAVSANVCGTYDSQARLGLSIEHHLVLRYCSHGW